jgi:hypothetical protein
MMVDVDQVLISMEGAARLAPHPDLLPEGKKVILYRWNFVLHD